MLARCLQSLAVLQVYGIDAADGEDSIVRIVARLSICAVVSHSERQVRRDGRGRDQNDCITPRIIMNNLRGVGQAVILLPEILARLTERAGGVQVIHVRSIQRSVEVSSARPELIVSIYLAAASRSRVCAIRCTSQNYTLLGTLLRPLLRLNHSFQIDVLPSLRVQRHEVCDPFLAPLHCLGARGRTAGFLAAALSSGRGPLENPLLRMYQYTKTTHMLLNVPSFSSCPPCQLWYQRSNPVPMVR